MIFLSESTCSSALSSLLTEQQAGLCWAHPQSCRYESCLWACAKLCFHILCGGCCSCQAKGSKSLSEGLAHL